MKRLRTAWCIALGLLLSAHTLAASFEGVVQHVTDGDTLWVRPERGGAAIAVRIEGIDAPETCQPGGREAREALWMRLHRQRVRIDVRGKDIYERLLARVEEGGDDVGRWMVRRGHAWAWRQRGDAGRYAADERLARQGRLGLWGSPDPMEPRLFRRFNGPCRTDAA